MKITLARNCGFCYGVKRAVDMAQSCIGSYEQAHTLGPIIHNPQMVEHLAAQGIGMKHNLAEIEQGAVIIRSHGVGPDVYAKAEQQGLTVVDATCPHVQKAQQAARRLAQDGYFVVIVGEHKHPEVKSIVEWSGGRAAIVETEGQAVELAFHDKIGIVVQTTFAGDAFEKIAAVLTGRAHEVKIERTICTATDLRQQAAAELATTVDIMIVVGGKNSANTTHLADLCRQAGCKTYHIETAQELIGEWFQQANTVGITAGASTPAWLIEEVCNKMQQMSELMGDIKKLQIGSIIQGTVVSVRQDEVFIDIGHKAEGVIPLAELSYPVAAQAADVVQAGDVINVYVSQLDGNSGLQLSKIKADQAVGWEMLTAALAESSTVTAVVTGVVKGGLAVALAGIAGFIPASHVDLRYTENLAQYVGQSLLVIPIELDQEKQRVVLSRKLVLAAEKRCQEDAIFAALKADDVLTGKVSRIVDYGAFIDIGGLDGLAHISDLSWERVKTPHDVVAVGDEVQVVVLKVDAAARRVSLSLKQVTRDPWLDKVDAFQTGSIVSGTVTKLMGFGAFVELTKGIEGLVRLSELAERKVAKAEEVVAVGQAINVKVLDIDKQAKKIGLSIIQASQDAERAEYQEFLSKNTATGLTLADKFGHLFKREG